MKIKIQYIAVMCILLAAAAWVGVWYAGNGILEESAARASTASSAQVQSDRAAYTQRVAAIVADTKQERYTLESASGKNIVSIVTMIEGIGAKTGITVKVQNAQPQGGSVPLSTDSALSRFAFSVEADGSFAQVMRALKALETLPVPSSVDQIEIMQNGGAKNGSWHLSARVGVFTTSAAS